MPHDLGVEGTRRASVLAVLRVKGQTVGFPSVIELQEIWEFSKKTIWFAPDTFLAFLIPFFPRERGLEGGSLTDRLHP